MLNIKTILLGLGAAVVTGGALLGGSNAIKGELDEKKAAEDFQKRSLERHDGYAIVAKKKRFGRRKLVVEEAIFDGNGNLVEGGDK
jgi:hypothetical protein